MPRTSESRGEVRFPPSELARIARLRRALTTHDDIRGLCASDAMTRTPVTIGPEASLAEALELMERRRSQISVLPVVDNTGRAVGIIRIHDIYLGNR